MIIRPKQSKQLIKAAKTSVPTQVRRYEFDETYPLIGTVVIGFSKESKPQTRIFHSSKIISTKRDHLKPSIKMIFPNSFNPV